MEASKTSGNAILKLGFSTFRMPRGGCQQVVESALAAGYRHIDTAERRLRAASMWTR